MPDRQNPSDASPQRGGRTIGSKRLLGRIVAVLVLAILAFLVVGLILDDSLPGRLLRGSTVDEATQSAGFLASFTAKARGERVMLRWATTLEGSTVGFNIYFGTSPDGPWSPLNTELIPSQVPPGSTSGARYEFEHDDSNPSVPRFYLLEDVANNGVSTRYGPIAP